MRGQISGYFSLISSVISDLALISANLKVGLGMGTDWRLPDGSWLNFSGPNMGWFGRTDQTSGGELPDLDWGSIPWPINLADYLGLPNLPSLNLGGTNGDGSDF